MQKHLFLVLLFSSIFSFSQDCDYSFTGNIIDFHDGTPLAGASVTIANTNKIVQANFDGEFSLSNICEGQYTINVSHAYCDSKSFTVTINGNTVKSFKLEHHTEELNEILVRSVLKVESTSIEQSIDKQTIETYADKSLGDALNTISGVSTLNTGNSIVKPMIHGLHSSRLIIINNNVRQFDQEWGDEHAPNIDINASSRISVVKGANTLIYGSDAIGGLILINPKRYQQKDSLYGSSLVSFNSNGLGGVVNTELVKTYKSGYYLRGQTSLKRFGDFSSANYNLSNSGIKSLNAATQFGYKTFEKGFDAYYSYVNNSIGILRAAHVGNINDLVRAINRGEPGYIGDFSYNIDNPRQAIEHHLAKLETYKRFSSLGKLSLQLDFQYNKRQEFDRRRSSLSDVPSAEFRLFTTSFQPNLKIDALDDFEFNTGFLFRYQKNTSADVSETGISIPLIPNYENLDLGGYITGNHVLNDNTEISAGIRYDYNKIKADKKYKLYDWEYNNYDTLFPEFSTGITENYEIYTTPEFDFHNLSASLGFIKYLGDNFEFIANYGLASRTPNVAELFSDGLHHSAARIETGSLTINKEVANKFMLALEKKHPDFGFSVSPYYKKINDFIQLIPGDRAFTTIRGVFVGWEYDQVDARIFGVDLDLNKRISNHFTYTGNLSLLRGDNITDNIPLINMPATNFSNHITYVNDNWNQLSISLIQKTICKQSRYPDYNFTSFDPILQEDVLVNISSTPSTYTLFGIQTAAEFDGFKKSKIRLELNVDNMFNIAYREHLNRLRYFADDLGRNINFKININY